jgi:predicted nucleic acid-binding protein
MIYVLDANAIIEWLSTRGDVFELKMIELVQQKHRIGSCSPVYYEISRGLRWRFAPKKLDTFEKRIIPFLETYPLIDADWDRAATLWADTRRAGKQLSDIDLLLAALVSRIDATLISQDADFDSLPIRRAAWQSL